MSDIGSLEWVESPNRSQMAGILNRKWLGSVEVGMFGKVESWMA